MDIIKVRFFILVWILALPALAKDVRFSHNYCNDDHQYKADVIYHKVKERFPVVVATITDIATGKSCSFVDNVLKGTEYSYGAQVQTPIESIWYAAEHTCPDLYGSFAFYKNNLNLARYPLSKFDVYLSLRVTYDDDTKLLLFENKKVGGDGVEGSYE